ncbi:hypothetical protein Tco_0378450 [Tanacetum coccineum]
MAVLESSPSTIGHISMKTEGNAEFSNRSLIFLREVPFIMLSLYSKPTEDEGVNSERPSDALPTPSPPHSSEVPVEPQTDPSPTQTSEVPLVPQTDPSPTHTIKVPVELQTDPSPRPSPSTTSPDSKSRKFSGGILEVHSPVIIPFSGNEGEMTLQSVYDLCISLCTHVSDQAKEIQHLKAQIKKLKKQAKPVIPLDYYMETEDCSRRGSNKRGSVRREGEMARLNRNGIPEAEKKFKQLASDEEMARKEEDKEEEGTKKKEGRSYQNDCHRKKESKKTISDVDNGDYLVIYRANGNFRAFNYLMEVLHIFDRQDLFHLYDLIRDQFSEVTLDGFELILWGDLKIMMESSTEGNEQSDFWSGQQDWKIVTWRLYESCGVCILEFEDGIVIHMLVERRYPLSKELMQRMLDLGLEVERESSVALDLIRFIKQQIDEE